MSLKFCLVHNKAVSATATLLPVVDGILYHKICHCCCWKEEQSAMLESILTPNLYFLSCVTIAAHERYEVTLVMNIQYAPKYTVLEQYGTVIRYY